MPTVYYNDVVLLERFPHPAYGSVIRFFYMSLSIRQMAVIENMLVQNGLRMIYEKNTVAYYR